MLPWHGWVSEQVEENTHNKEQLLKTGVFTGRPVGVFFHNMGSLNNNTNSIDKSLFDNFVFFSDC